VRKNWLALALVAGLVAACGGSTTTGSLQASGTPAGGTQTGASQAPASQTAAGASATPTGGAPKTLDACSLITTAEAAAALGKPVDPGVVPEPGAHSCLFSDAAVSTDGVEISINNVADFNPTQKSIPGITITQVSGVGDAAYTTNVGAGMVVLKVRKGQTAFTTSVLLKGASDSELLAAEKTLALAVLGRI
jgi:hypothetical protein